MKVQNNPDGTVDIIGMTKDEFVNLRQCVADTVAIHDLSWANPITEILAILTQWRPKK